MNDAPDEQLDFSSALRSLCNDNGRIVDKLVRPTKDAAMSLSAGPGAAGSARSSRLLVTSSGFRHQCSGVLSCNVRDGPGPERLLYITVAPRGALPTQRGDWMNRDVLWLLGGALVLALVAAALGRRPLHEKSALLNRPWPLERKSPLLSQPEQVLYRRLVQSCPAHIVLCQVQVMQMLRFKRGRGIQVSQTA